MGRGFGSGGNGIGSGVGVGGCGSGAGGRGSGAGPGPGTLRRSVIDSGLPIKHERGATKGAPLAEEEGLARQPESGGHPFDATSSMCPR